MKRIEIRADRRSPRRWHGLLLDRLRRNLPGSEITLSLVEGEGTYPGPVSALLALERVVLGKGRSAFCDPLSPDDARLGPQGSDVDLDVVIDCSGGTAQASGRAGRTLRPLFDGFPEQQALIGTLLSGRVPEVSVEDRETGEILGVARPSGEGVQGLTDGMDAALSRLLLLIERVLRCRTTPTLAAGRPRFPSAGRSRVASFAFNNWAHHCARAIYHLCFLAPHWRIGWRFNDGPGVLERGDLAGPRWRAIEDPGTRCFADPFPVTWRGRTCVFFEDLDHRVGKGVISTMAFDDDGPCGEAMPVIEEDWHLSYPFVLEHAGALWMVPESSQSGQVPLYRCIDFPFRWERCGTLINNIEASDSTLFPHEGRFWMTSVSREGVGGFSDTLVIHHAADLHGPWTQHGNVPALIDAGAARPAGAVVRRGDELWRPVQDCSRGYGRSMKLARIDVLDPERFSQTVTKCLTPDRLWPGGRLHTLNRAGRIECIDGTTYNPRLRALRPYFAARMEPGIAAPDLGAFGEEVNGAFEAAR